MVKITQNQVWFLKNQLSLKTTQSEGLKDYVPCQGGTIDMGKKVQREADVAFINDSVANSAYSCYIFVLVLYG